MALISILVAAWNAAETLPHLIHSFTALHYPHKELILCVGGEDGSWALSQQWVSETVHVVCQQPSDGKRGALERGLAHVHGDVVFLTDADCMLNDAGVEGMIRPILHNNAQVTTGSYHPFPEQQYNPFVMMQWAKIRQREQHDPSETNGHLVGINTAISANLYRHYLPQIPQDTLVEDGYLGQLLRRDGIVIHWQPHCQVATLFHTCMRPYIRQQSRWLRGAWQISRQFGDEKLRQKTVRTARYGFYLLLLPLLSLPLPRVGTLLTLLAWGKAAHTYTRLTEQPNWRGAIHLLVADVFVWTRALTLDRWRGDW
ncbi:MAG: glycosyltransferase [Candidatus Promineifilaceae bacterium]